MSQKSVNWHSDNIATIDNFLTAEECQNFIKLSENSVYDEAPITTQAGAVLRQDVRNNDRFILDDEKLAAFCGIGWMAFWMIHSVTGGSLLV